MEGDRSGGRDPESETSSLVTGDLLGRTGNGIRFSSTETGRVSILLSWKFTALGQVKGVRWT